MVGGRTRAAEAAIRGTGVRHAVVVQATSSLAETRWLLVHAAASDGTVAGVVGWADLTKPTIASGLRGLRGEHGGELLRGIRHQVHDEEDPRWLLREDVLRGLAAVRDAGLLFDLLVRPRELPAAIELAERMPDLRLVLDHAGKPPIATGEREPWAGLLARLAASPNVSCKLSGLVTEASKNWTVDLIAPWAEHVLSCFGPERIMFGSDWPVSTLRAPYGRVLELTEALLAGLPEARRHEVMQANAAGIYGLDLQDTPTTREERDPTRQGRDPGLVGPGAPRNPRGWASPAGRRWDQPRRPPGRRA